MPNFRSAEPYVKTDWRDYADKMLEQILREDVKTS